MKHDGLFLYWNRKIYSNNLYPTLVNVKYRTAQYNLAILNDTYIQGSESIYYSGIPSMKVLRTSYGVNLQNIFSYWTKNILCSVSYNNSSTVTNFTKDSTYYDYSDKVTVLNKDLLTDITLPEYQTLVAEHFCENGTDVQKPIEFKIKALDGSIKWISHFCRAVYDEDKNYLGQRGVNRDITEHKEQLKMLLKLNKAITNSSDIIFMTDEIY